MSTIVQRGHLEIQSNSESAEDLVRVLNQEKEPDKVARPIKDRGKDVEAKPEKQPITVQEAGKKGAAAAAKAREAKEREEEHAKPSEKGDEPADKQEAKESGDDEEVVRARAEGDEAVPEAKRTDDTRLSLKARMAELARQKAEARREAEAARLEAEAARREAEQLRGGGQPGQAPQRGTQADPGDPEPTLDKYQTWEEYHNDHTRWVSRQEFARLEQERNRQAWQAAQMRYVEEQNKAFQDRWGAETKADPELETKIDPNLVELLDGAQENAERLGHQTASSTLADEVRTTDHPARLLAYFSENPEEVRKIVALPNARLIARAVALIEAKFDAPSHEAESEPDKPAVRLPQPIRPVGGSAQPGDVESELTREMSFDEYHKKRARWGKK